MSNLEDSRYKSLHNTSNASNTLAILVVHSTIRTHRVLLSYRLMTSCMLILPNEAFLIIEGLNVGRLPATVGALY